MKLNDEIIVDIEKVTYGGLGLSRYKEERFVVFVENALQGEKIKAKITKLNKTHAKAEIIEILKESPNRTKPFCPLYNACGSCDNQICDYNYSIVQKTKILKEIFSDVVEDSNIYNVIPSTKTLEYRHKIQYPARQTKNSKRILLGYYKKNSHNLTNIKFCPIQPKIINEITQFLRENLSINCYNEEKNKGLLKNVLFRISNDNKQILLTFVLNCNIKDYQEKYKKYFSEFAQKLLETYSEIKGVNANLNNQKTNRILGETNINIKGQDYITETLEEKSYAIGPTSFFQVNPSSAVNLFNVAKQNIKENSTILDAYGGVGAIGIFVSEKAKKITLVEENKNAILMAEKNFKLNNIKNYEILEGDAKTHLLNFRKEKRIFDYIILDPPRQGCSKESLDTLSSLGNNIIYVSCNPQTLKRDTMHLIKDNFIPQFVQGVDLFPFTHHIETIILFKKEQTHGK